jgi:hypothetical protein
VFIFVNYNTILTVAMYWIHFWSAVGPLHEQKVFEGLKYRIVWKPLLRSRDKKCFPRIIEKNISINKGRITTAKIKYEAKSRQIGVCF